MSVICLHTFRWNKLKSNVNAESVMQRVVFHELGVEDLWDALVTSRQSLKRKRVTCSPRSQGLSPRAMVSTLCTRVRWEDSRLACKSTNQKTDVSANGANKCLTIADLNTFITIHMRPTGCWISTPVKVLQLIRFSTFKEGGKHHGFICSVCQKAVSYLMSNGVKLCLFVNVFSHSRGNDEMCWICH